MFYFEDFFGKKVLKSSLLNELEHFFTTRDFILKAGELEDKEELAEKNREFLCEKLQINKSNLMSANQIHSNKVDIVSKKQNFYDNCDGLISNIDGTAIMVNFADCVPVILFDPVNNAASVVHAGWRGTAKKIVQEAVCLMTKKMGSKSENIRAAIGPAISETCFSVEEDVYKELVGEQLQGKEAQYNYNEQENKYYVDLKNLNKIQLLDTGVKEIDVCGYCTSCMSDIFFSYRKEAGRTARQSAVVKLGKRR